MPSYERDRFGQRPLYYAARGGRLHVAPRVDRLLAEAGLPRVVDPRAAALALADALPPGDSLFRGVSRVPPGHVVREGEGSPVLEAVPPPEPTAARGLIGGLRAAVAETGPGAACALSGGLDSGLLLALMSEGGATVRAYTLDNDFGDAAELRAAELLAATCRAEHVVVRLREELLPDHVFDTVRACEEPIWNGAAVARRLFFRSVRKAGELALVSGVGADELLCGNPAAMRAWPGKRHAARALAEELLQGGLPAACAESEADLDALRGVFVRKVLPDSTLPPECRCSEAEGVEARLPYLHPALAAAALALPTEACVRGDEGKQPLREAARGLVPESVRAAPKTARLAPSGGANPRARARWRELYAAWLTPERLAPLGCVEPKRARALLDRGGDADALLLRLVSLAMLAEPA